MADTVEVPTSTPSELLASGRRDLAVKEFTSAVETLAAACELLAKEHGDTADQCAEAYLWYGKALLGLSREESGVLGDGVPGTGNAEEEEENDEKEGENGEASEENTGEAEAVKENGDVSTEEKGVGSSKEADPKQSEAESTTNDEGMSADNEEPGTTNGDAEEGDGDVDVSMMNAEGEDDVDNLQLAWEMLDLSRSILFRRVQEGGGAAARALLADVHLALGEVALESETYDKAVVDMQSCLDLQKDLYGADDRRIAETHYQIGLANSLASNFEDAITHFKNAANILVSRVSMLEARAPGQDKLAATEPGYSIEGEIKELKELLPEIQEKIQDMVDYKTETIKRMRESLFSNGAGSSASSFSSGSGFANGSSSGGSSTSQAKPAADITHLIKRKRKASETEAESTAKKPNMEAKSASNEAESSVAPSSVIPEKAVESKAEADSSKTADT